MSTAAAGRGRRRTWRTAALGLTVLAVGGGLAACGSDDDGDTTTAAGTAAATTASNAVDGFPTVTPEPGTEIPKATVKLGMRPYADNAIHYVAIKNGMYADNGIEVAPKPYGVKNNDQAIAQMLNGTVEMQAMYAPSLVPTFKTDRSLKQVMFTNYFNGWALLAAPDSGAKPVSEYLKQGLPFKEAMAKSLEPMKGKTLVVSQLLDARDFTRQSFEIAGMEQPKLQILDDPKSLVAARAGKIEFAVPTGAPTTMQFEREGWIPLVRPFDIIDNAEEAGTDVSALAGGVGLASNEDWLKEHPNTALRVISATYRMIDEIKAKPELLDDYATYLNSLTGLKQTGEDLGELFKTYSPLTDFEFGETYCEDESALLHVQKAYTGIIAAYAKQGAIDEGSVKPEDVIWVCGAWKQLNDFKTKTDELLKAGDGDAALLEQAKELYDQRNYLDSYRLATAATSAS